jgi:hypothetical protein
MTHFSLSNGHWHRKCGHIQMREKNLHLTKKLELQPAIDDLAAHTSRVHTSSVYLEHVAAKLRTLDKMKTRMITTSPRRWAFDCYRREQLAVHELSKDLLAQVASVRRLSCGAMVGSVQLIVAMRRLPISVSAVCYPNMSRSFSRQNIDLHNEVRVVMSR